MVTTGYYGYTWLLRLHLVTTVTRYLLVELLGDAPCPLKMQIFALGGSIDVGQLDDHLHDEHTVRLLCPVDPHRVVVVHLSQNTRSSSLQLMGVESKHMLIIITTDGC